MHMERINTMRHSARHHRKKKSNAFDHNNHVNAFVYVVLLIVGLLVTVGYINLVF